MLEPIQLEKAPETVQLTLLEEKLLERDTPFLKNYCLKLISIPMLREKANVDGTVDRIEAVLMEEGVYGEIELMHYFNDIQVAVGSLKGLPSKKQYTEFKLGVRKVFSNRLPVTEAGRDLKQAFTKYINTGSSVTTIINRVHKRVGKYLTDK